MRGTILILLLIYRATESCPFGWVDPASESTNCYKISETAVDWGTAQDVSSL